MAWDDPSHPLFRFPYDSFRRAHRAFGGSIHLYVHQESLEKGKRIGMEALREGNKGASLHGGL